MGKNAKFIIGIKNPFCGTKPSNNEEIGFIMWHIIYKLSATLRTRVTNRQRQIFNEQKRHLCKNLTLTTF